MLYNIVHLLLGQFLRVVFRLRAINPENVPAGSGVVIAANHISLWDPPVIGCGLPVSRQVHMMAKEELFAIPVFGWVISHLYSFPVRRGLADRNAIRTALDILRNGGAVGMFPEGTRSKTGQLGPAMPGMAMLAVKAAVPVVPAAVFGTNKVFRQGNILPRFTIRFGAPLYARPDMTDKENIEWLNNAVMAEIARMLAEEETEGVKLP